MANVKISALPSASALTGSELVPVVQGGTTKRTTTGAISAPVTVEVTTGASPTDITLSDYGNWMILAVLVTSGGTADVEVLNFIGPDAGEGGNFGNTYVGRTINVVFVAQTDPADVIHITQNTDGVISCIDNLGDSIGYTGNGVFDEVGNNIIFEFNGDIIQQYAWGCRDGAWNSPTAFTGKRNPLPSGGAYGQLPFSQGDGTVSWSGPAITPWQLVNAGTVAALYSGFPPASYSCGLARVVDADTPVVGNVVVGGGGVSCIVVTNTAQTDYVVMFILP